MAARHESLGLTQAVLANDQDEAQARALRAPQLLQEALAWERADLGGLLDEDESAPYLRPLVAAAWAGRGQAFLGLLAAHQATGLPVVRDLDHTRNPVSILLCGSGQVDALRAWLAFKPEAVHDTDGHDGEDLMAYALHLASPDAMVDALFEAEARSPRPDPIRWYPGNAAGEKALLAHRDRYAAQQTRAALDTTLSAAGRDASARPRL